MPNPCKCCNHAQVTEINRRLIGGAKLETVAQAFGLTIANIFNHKKNHLGKPLKAKSDFEIQQQMNETLLEEISKLSNEGQKKLEPFLLGISRAEQLFYECQRTGSAVNQLKALTEIRTCNVAANNFLTQIKAEAEMQRNAAETDQGGARRIAALKADRGFKHLSIEELVIYRRILYKMINLNDDIIILDGKIIKRNKPIDSQEDLNE